MATAAPEWLKLELIYEEAEQRYLRSLPPEHFMEATPHATQRKITLESFDLIHAARPDVQCFNELLVQYPGPDPSAPRGVVPDNMVVVHPEPIAAKGSFNTPLQPVGPCLVLEYVSESNKRKDYEDNLRRYRDDLRVPYYLLFDPEEGELTVFRLAGDRYRKVAANAMGRLEIPQLELEVALLNGWVRFWFRGELQPLPADLLRRLAERDRELTAERSARVAAERRAADAEAELARLRAERANGDN
jgi:Uma2 family endonuclease